MPEESPLVRVCRKSDSPRKKLGNSRAIGVEDLKPFRENTVVIKCFGFRRPNLRRKEALDDANSPTKSTAI